MNLDLDVKSLGNYPRYQLRNPFVVGRIERYKLKISQYIKDNSSGEEEN
jgi:hypothetical protein